MLRYRFPHLVVAALALGTLACLGDGNSYQRNVNGQVQTSSYALVDPVIVAQASDGRVFVTSVDAAGQFTLTLPAEVDYRLLLADRLGNGRYRTVSHIRWPTAKQGHWGHCHAGGGDIDVGTIYPHGCACGGVDAGATDAGVVDGPGSATSPGSGPFGYPGCACNGGNGGNYGGDANAVDGGAGSFSGCHEEDNAVSCDLVKAALESDCSATGVSDVDDQVDHNTCQHAEQMMNAACAAH